MSTFLGIDFASLTLQDALDLAVLIEEEASERYQDLADQLELHHTPEAAKFFRFMATNEERHQAELARQRRELFQDRPARITRGMLFEVEAPEFDEVRLFMSVREALRVALRAEQKAFAFFSETLPRLRDVRVRELFSELADEEVRHQNLVLAELERAPAESPPEDRVEDEPVAQ